MMDLERASAAYAIWRWLRHNGLADVSLANRLAPVALAYWAAPGPDPCVAAGVAFHLKQLGGPKPTSGGRLLDGREWNQFPDGAGGMADA